MVKHIVMWKLKEFDAPEERAAAISRIRTGLEALPAIVPGMLSAHVAEGYNPNGYALCLYSKFESREALDAYQPHPEHMKVREFLRTVTTDCAICDWEE